MKCFLLLLFIFCSLHELDAQTQLIFQNDSTKKVDFSVIEDSTASAQGHSYILPNIAFDFDSYHLRPQSLDILDQLAHYLNQNNNLLIEISNHRDCRGSDKYSRNLTGNRAQSVMEYLISKGVPKERLTAKGYGDSKPIVIDNQEYTCGYIASFESDKPLQEKFHQLNRRTEFTILSREYSSKE